MNGKFKLTIEFLDLENLHNTQVDLINVMQSALNSDIRNEAGYYVLDLLRQLSNESFEVASKAIIANQKLKPVA